MLALLALVVVKGKGKAEGKAKNKSSAGGQQRFIGERIRDVPEDSTVGIDVGDTSLTRAGLGDLGRHV